MVKEIYEKVNLIVPTEHRRFFNLFNDTVDELLARCHKFVLEEGKEFGPISSLEDECFVLPLYKAAIAENILFLLGAGDIHKQEYTQKVREAYLKYWNDSAHNKVQKRARW